MKSLLKNVRVLNFEDLLKINGGYSGSSGGGGSSSSGSRSGGGSGSRSSSSSSYSSSRSSSGYSGCSGGSGSKNSGASSRSSSYSASSGGSGKTVVTARSAYSCGSAGLNDPRVTLYEKGVAYSSLSGFIYLGENTPAYSASSAGVKAADGAAFTLKSENQISDCVTRMNQMDFGYVSDEFGRNACCATSLLNELSEIATAEKGEKNTIETMKSAMEAAINSGAIDKNSGKDCGYVRNYINAANAMAKEMGLSGEFYETTYGSKNRTTLIFAVDKNNDEKHIPDHFYASVDDHTYYDPWTGKTGNISDFAANGWTYTTRCLGYRSKK